MTFRRHASLALGLALCAAALVSAGCRKGGGAEDDDKDHAAQPAPDTGAARALTLTAEAARKIGLETETARLSTIGERLTLLGALDVNRDEPLLVVRAPEAGTLSSLDAAAGDFVRKGQELARIGSRAVVAPVSANVAEVTARSGDSVTKGQGLLSLLDVSGLVAYLNVYEDQLRKVHAGQTVVVSLPALPQKTFSGRLESVSPQLDPQTRAAVVQVSVQNAGGELKPGMAVSGSIAIGGAQKGLVVPQTAVVFDAQGGSWVYVQAKPLSFVRQPAEVDFIGGGQVWVKRGLSEGQVYVTLGAGELFSEEFSGQISTGD